MSYKQNKNDAEEYYRGHVLPKLAKISTKHVPDDIWINIKNNIVNNEIRQKAEGAGSIFRFPQYAFASAAACLLLVISAYSYQEITMYNYVNKQLSGIVNYLGSDNSLVGDEFNL